jgi:hypothetical protein
MRIFVQTSDRRRVQRLHSFLSGWFSAFLRKEKIMDHPKSSAAAVAPRDSQAEQMGTETAQPISSPATDPTNPHNQEPTGDWVANERAAERRNSEPGLTDAERKSRKY